MAGLCCCLTKEAKKKKKKKANRAAIVGIRDPKQEWRGRAACLSPACLAYAVCLLACHLSIEAHIPFLSLENISPKRAALLGDLAWPREGRGEGRRVSEGGGQGEQMEISCEVESF